MDAEFSSEAQPMQQQMQQEVQEMYFAEESPDQSDSAAEDSAEPVIFARLESGVLSVAFSPDGRKIIAGLDDGTLRLFDAISGKPIGKPFQGHEKNVNSVAFSPDGKAIVSGSSDSTLRLWDLQGNQIGQPFQGHEHVVNSVAFSPDNKLIVSGSFDHTLRLWNLQGKPIGDPFQGHKSWVNSLAFSHDSKVIISGGNDAKLRLWDLDGKQIKTFLGHVSAVTTVAFSPDDKSVVSGSVDKMLRRWDLQGEHLGNPFLGHGDVVWSVAFSPDGKVIVSGSLDRTIRLWNLDGKEIGKTFLGHEDMVRAVAFSPDVKTIVSSSSDKTIRLWNLNGEMIPNLADRIRQIEIPQGVANDSPQGQDCLNVQDEIEALSTVMMLRSLQPPIAVAILGSWGSGKSFGMNLIQQRIEAIRRQKLTRLEAWGDLGSPQKSQLLSPYVGHIYQISFNAWTYAKSDLWASLMQEIFYELNRQITLEQQIGIFLSTLSISQQTTDRNLSKSLNTRNIDRLIYKPFNKLKKTIKKSVDLSKKKLVVFSQQILNFWIVQFLLYFIIYLLIIIFHILIWLIFVFDQFTNRKFHLAMKVFDFQFIRWSNENSAAYYLRG